MSVATRGARESENEDHTNPRRTKRKSKHELAVSDMEAIIAEVRRAQLTYVEVAYKHKVAPRLVQSLMSRTKRNADFLPRETAKEEARKTKLRVVMSTAESMLATPQGITKADDL